MPKLFFTSDLHFHHRSIQRFCPTFRPDLDLREMSERLIAYWNATVSSDDVVYNLGDFSFSQDLAEIISVLERLNGKHHLILGNHDSLIAEHQDRLLTQKKHDGLPLFSSIQHYKRLYLPNGNSAVLFHYPLQEWDDAHFGTYMLYGHIHDRVAEIKGKLLNVGYDLHGRFLTVDDVQMLLDGLPQISYFGLKGQGFTPTADIQENQKALGNYLRNLNN